LGIVVTIGDKTPFAQDFTENLLFFTGFARGKLLIPVHWL